MIKPLHTVAPVFLLCSCLAAQPLLAESKFTLETVKGKLTASWIGPADPTALDAAPSDEDIAGLTAFPDIEVIYISGATNFTGAGFASLKNNSKLREISLNGTGPGRFSEMFRPDTLEGYHALAQLPQVETLRCGHVKVSTEGAEIILKGMKGLKSFGIGTYADDRILQAATESQSLTSISFGHWATVPDASLTKAGIAAVARIPNLENISLGSLGPSDASPAETFALLAQATNLKGLQISLGSSERNAPKVSIKTDDLSPLATLTELTRLSFEKISFPATAFSSLKGHAKLEIVQLSHCEVATGALKPLAELPNLKSLQGQNSVADPADILAIKAAKPKLRITGF